jgi:hypothetical protein
MPPNILEEFEKRDVYKSRIYQLCDFLIKKREDPKCRHITRPLNIPLKEMGEIFEYINADTQEEKIKKLKESLENLKEGILHLSEDSIDENTASAVIVIKNPEILDNFLENFNANKEIIIKCSVERLREYKAKLIKLTQEIDFDAGEFSLRRVSDEKYFVCLHNKEMPITSGNKHTHNGETGIPLKLSIILLLFGKKIPVASTLHIQNNEETSIRLFDQILKNRREGYRSNDYQPGHDLSIEALKLILAYAMSPILFDNPANEVIKRQAITEAIYAIEEDSKEKLGKPLLIRSDDKTSVHLNITL